MSGYLHFERTGVETVDAILEALERAGDLFHHTDQWNDGYPTDDDASPADAIRHAVGIAAAEIRKRGTALREARALTEKWRYQSGRCPACHQAPHTAECFVVKLIDVLSSPWAQEDTKISQQGGA